RSSTSEEGHWGLWAAYAWAEAHSRSTFSATTRTHNMHGGASPAGPARNGSTPWTERSTPHSRSQRHPACVLTRTADPRKPRSAACATRAGGFVLRARLSRHAGQRTPATRARPPTISSGDRGGERLRGLREPTRSVGLSVEPRHARLSWPNVDDSGSAGERR